MVAGPRTAAVLGLELVVAAEFLGPVVVVVGQQELVVVVVLEAVGEVLGREEEELPRLLVDAVLPWPELLLLVLVVGWLLLQVRVLLPVVPFACLCILHMGNCHLCVWDCFF